VVAAVSLFRGSADVRALPVLALVAGLTALVVFARKAVAAPAPDEPVFSDDLFSVGGLMDWLTNLRESSTANYEKYRDVIAAAEQAQGIPEGLLARLLYQESHYRSDIIDGSTRSGTGALGIAQFMPATAADMGIDPLNPFQAIDGAARYLRLQYNSFRDWRLALAAYNAGPGNVRKYNGVPPFTETLKYVAEIAADVGLA